MVRTDAWCGQIHRVDTVMVRTDRLRRMFLYDNRFIVVTMIRPPGQPAYGIVSSVTIDYVSGLKLLHGTAFGHQGT